MRRLEGAFIALVLTGVAGPSAAADISHVASSGERNKPFELDITVRWERFQERATINREDVGGIRPGGAIVDGDELRYVRTRNAIVPRIAVGLYRDLELSFEMPYVLTDDRSWRFGTVSGTPSGGVPGFPSTIETNPYDADGLTSVTGGTCTPGPCPLFPVGPTVFHGGRAGDLKVGLAWAIFNQKKDETKPFWIVGMNVTFPTAARYEPAKDRGADWSSPNSVAEKPAPIGEKVWKWDVYTILSRRMGYIDPYVKAHATGMFKTSSTYSNCDFVTELAAPLPNGRQMNSLAATNCATWGSEADAKLPWLAGLTVGTEVVPYEDRYEGQRVSLDFRLFADYTSAQRFYNELTDATGKLHMTQGYLTMGGLAGLYLHASKYVSLQATASLATRSAHYLTGESLGRNGGWPSVGSDGLTTDPAEMNPNFDHRYDAPGRRFRISEVTLFELGASAVMRF
jgi:hypothetical protein